MKLIVSKWEKKEGNDLSDNGLIRINPEKPEYGSLMLTSPVVTLGNGFINKRTKVGFIVGTVEDIEAIIKEYGIKEGSNWSELFGTHRIVTLEKNFAPIESQILHS